VKVNPTLSKRLSRQKGARERGFSFVADSAAEPAFLLPGLTAMKEKRLVSGSRRRMAEPEVGLGSL
jgi:hypothetical protein